MPEPPLSDLELRIIRGLIDDHQYRQARNRFLSVWVRDARTMFVALGFVILCTLEVIQIIEGLHHGH